MKMTSGARGDPIFEDRSFVAATNGHKAWPIAQSAITAWLWLGRLGRSAFRTMREARLRHELGHVTAARMRLFASAWAPHVRRASEATATGRRGIRSRHRRRAESEALIKRALDE